MWSVLTYNGADYCVEPIDVTANLRCTERYIDAANLEAVLIESEGEFRLRIWHPLEPDHAVNVAFGEPGNTYKLNIARHFYDTVKRFVSHDRPKDLARTQRAYERLGPLGL